MIYGPVAGLLFHTLTEEANFMPRLYSWIAVPPEQWLKEKRFPITHCSQGWGAERGLVWCHFMSFNARMELLGGLVRLSRHKT